MKRWLEVLRAGEGLRESLRPRASRQCGMT